jgi:hypothetical protein
MLRTATRPLPDCRFRKLERDLRACDPVPLGLHAGWMGAGADRRTHFFKPASGLRSLVQFGFAAAYYRRRAAGEIRRLPTGRATIYYAAHVRGPGLGRRDAGLYCEGPHAGGFTVSHESGELVAIKVRAGALGMLLGIPARELRDRTIDLEDVWGRRAR